MDIQVKKEKEETAISSDEHEEQPTRDSAANHKRPRLTQDKEEEHKTGGGDDEEGIVPDPVVSTSSTTVAITPNRCSVEATSKDTMCIVGTNTPSGEPAPSSSSTLPTAFQLSIELCKLVDMHKYSLNDDSLPTLKRIGAWAELSKNHGNKCDTSFFESLLLYGGLPRIVDFLRHNINDIRCVAMSAKLLSRCVVLSSTQSSGLGGLLADSIVDSHGIQALILASDTYSTSDATPLYQIWSSLSKLVSMESTRITMGWGQQAKVVDAALQCLEKQKECNIKNEFVLGKIMRTLDAIVLGNSSKYIKRLKEKNLVARCIASLYRQTDIKRTTFWVGDETTIASCLLMAVKCSEKDGLILQNTDFVKIIPFCVFAVKTFAEAQDIQEYAMILLTKATKQAKDKDIESSVLEAVVSLLKSEQLSTSVQEEARQLIKRMYETNRG